MLVLGISALYHEGLPAAEIGRKQPSVPELELEPRNRETQLPHTYRRHQAKSDPSSIDPRTDRVYLRKRGRPAECRPVRADCQAMAGRTPWSKGKYAR